MKVIYYLFIVILTTSVTFSQNVEWQVFTGSNSGLPDEFVLALAIESSGTKWIGTGGGLARFDGNNWDVYNASNSQLPYDWITALDLNGDNELWIGTFGAGLAKLQGTNWSVYTAANTGGMPLTTILSIATREGINPKLFGTNDGLVAYDGNQWSAFTSSNSGLPVNQVRSVAIEESNLWWVGTDAGLARFDGDWTIYNTSNSELPVDRINTIAIDSAGIKWFGTDGGLTRFDGTNWATFTSSNSGFPGGSVQGIDFDSNNNIWLATFGVTGGLVKFDGANWTLYNISNTGIWNYLRSIAIESNGNVWVGTNGFGLDVLNENGLTAVEQINESIVDEYFLEQNYPNPFNPSTSIQYQVSSISQVSLKVYDVLGNEVATLVNELKQAGSYEVEFDAKGLSSGIYFYKIQAGSFVETKKMLLLK